MSAIADKAAEIKAALQTVSGLSVYTEVDANPNVPCVYIGVPQLTWTRFNGSGADQATFPLAVVVAMNGYSMATMEPLIDQIADALAADPDSALTEGAPASWPIGPQTSLPAYVLTLETGL